MVGKIGSGLRDTLEDASDDEDSGDDTSGDGGGSTSDTDIQRDSGSGLSGSDDGGSPSGAGGSDDTDIQRDSGSGLDGGGETTDKTDSADVPGSQRETGAPADTRDDDPPDVDTPTPEEDTSERRSGSGPTAEEIERREAQDTDQRRTIAPGAAGTGLNPPETGIEAGPPDQTPFEQAVARARGNVTSNDVEAAQRFEDRLVEQRPFIEDEQDVAIRLAGGNQLKAEITRQRRRELQDEFSTLAIGAQRMQFRESVESRFDVDISPTEVQRQGNQFTLTESGQETLEAKGREIQRLSDAMAGEVPEETQPAANQDPAAAALDLEAIPDRPARNQLSGTAAPEGQFTPTKDGGNAFTQTAKFLQADSPEDLREAILGPPGALEQGFADVAGGVRDVSAEAAATVAPIGAKIASAPVQLTAPVTETVTGGRLNQDISKGLLTAAGRGGIQATVGAPASIIGAGALGAEAGQFTAEEIEEQGLAGGSETSAKAGAGFTAAATREIAQQAQENPVEFTGFVAGGAVAGTAITPVRFSRLDVPTKGGGSTAVRGVRLREPAIVRPITGRSRGKTVAGARGARPTVGAPSIRAADPDLSQLGTTPTRTAEAMSAFEADVFRATASDVGAPASTRFQAAEQIQRRAARRGASSRFEFDTPEEALGQARAVPESAVPGVADALRDLDATVFGSAAARAQVPEFRQPRDIDIVVSDEAAAKARLSEALEGETATVGDVFDIKTEAKVPGRASGGEQIKFGFESMEPKELGGVRFNPVEEELIRKAGASAFLREPGAAGTARFDVGPEPRSAGRPDVRRKDVTDTEMLAERLDVPESDLAEFQRAFDLSGAPPRSPGVVGRLPDAPDLPARLRAFAGDTRGQVMLGARRTTRTDTDLSKRTDVDKPPRADVDASDARRADTDADSPLGRRGARDSPSPGALAGAGRGAPSPGAGGGARSGGSPGGGAGSAESPVPGIPDLTIPGGGGGGGDRGGFDVPIITVPSPGDSPSADVTSGFGVPSPPGAPGTGLGTSPTNQPGPDIPLPGTRTTDTGGSPEEREEFLDEPEFDEFSKEFQFGVAAPEEIATGSADPTSDASDDLSAL